MNKVYRNIGICLLFISLILLATGLGEFIAPLMFLPGYYARLYNFLFAKGMYAVALFFIFLFLDTLLAIWGVLISIELIRKNKYIPLLFYWWYSLAGIKILSFLLNLPLKIYVWSDLLVGIAVLLLLYRREGQFSQLVKKKAK